jgi:hypothetical protein
MPGSVNQAAHASWSIYAYQALRDLLQHPQHTATPGCDFIAASGIFHKPYNSVSWAYLSCSLQNKSSARERRNQIPVLCLSALSVPASLLRLEVLKALPNSKLMPNFGLNTCRRLVNFVLHYQLLELLYN